MKLRSHRLAQALVSLTLLLGACRSAPPASPPPGSVPVPARVAEVQRRDVPVRLRAIGTVEAYSTVTLTPQIDGQLAEAHFREGQWVQRGDRLFTIDPRPFEAALRQAQANLHRAQSELRNADTEAKRKGSLAAQGFVSAEENEAAQTRASSLRSSVKGAEAAIENAQLQLQYCFIDSPVEGRIGEWLVHPGNVVRKNETKLAVIHQVRPVYVAFSVRDQDLPEVRRRTAEGALRVEAMVNDGNPPAEGELTFINNAVDPGTGTVMLKARFVNTDERLWPGQFVEIGLTVRVEAGALVVPAGAVLTGQQGKYVFVVRPDSTVEARPVQTGIDLEGEVTITAGLEAGEPVVTEGQIRLAPGFRVERKDNEAGSTPKAAS